MTNITQKRKSFQPLNVIYRSWIYTQWIGTTNKQRFQVERFGCISQLLPSWCSRSSHKQQVFVWPRRSDFNSCSNKRFYRNQTNGEAIFRKFGRLLCDQDFTCKLHSRWQVLVSSWNLFCQRSGMANGADLQEGGREVSSLPRWVRVWITLSVAIKTFVKINVY